jgi:hypothetical protein
MVYARAGNATLTSEHLERFVITLAANDKRGKRFLGARRPDHRRDPRLHPLLHRGDRHARRDPPRRNGDAPRDLPPSPRNARTNRRAGPDGPVRRRVARRGNPTPIRSETFECQSRSNVLGDKPFCLYITEAMTKRHRDGTRHFYPGIVVQDEPGYYTTDWDYGTDFAEAVAAVVAANAAHGISQVEATEIVGSSRS